MNKRHNVNSTVHIERQNANIHEWHKDGLLRSPTFRNDFFETKVHPNKLQTTIPTEPKNLFQSNKRNKRYTAMPLNLNL